MARGTLRVLCECVRFCNGGRQRSRTTWYAHAPYRIGGRYAHFPYEPSAALYAFLTFGNDSDSVDSTDSDVLAKGRGWNTETVNLDTATRTKSMVATTTKYFYGGGRGGMGSDEEEKPRGE
ncbi:hypothetical protein MKEN_00192800 [Mycena kentingensis (nom. inval.)]|nr:hypothetical protein MKEN_00192800 [Mycena kentingensis (nom. inval.)]